MKPSQALLTLRQQHERIRELAAALDTQAAKFRVEAGAAAPFRRAAFELRMALAEHNVAEEAYLRPILAAEPTVGAARVNRMMEEHVGEHVAFLRALEGDAPTIAERIPDFLEELEAHLQAEERTFLNVAVLKDR